jgi:hypothetical protein
MPNRTPLTNTSAALRDVIAAVERVNSDITWPSKVLALVRVTFHQAIGDFLTDQGAEHPELDLWNGKHFAEFKDFVLGRVVPEVVNVASTKLHRRGVMTADAFRSAALEILPSNAIRMSLKRVLKSCWTHADRPHIQAACKCPPILTGDEGP